MSEAPTPTETPEAEAPVPPAEGAAPGSLVGGAPSGEPKPEGETPPEAPAGAPEKYEFKLPEGFEAKPEDLTKFEEMAKAANLPQETAQNLLNAHLEQVKSLSDAFAKEQKDAWETTTTEWRKQIDQVFPGEKLTQAQVVVGRALDEYGTPEVRQAFDFTGAGNNPAVFSFIHKMAEALSEGKLTPGGTPPGTKSMSLGERLYGAS